VRAREIENAVVGTTMLEVTMQMVVGEGEVKATYRDSIARSSNQNIQMLWKEKSQKVNLFESSYNLQTQKLKLWKGE
jgi:hypothetical protein